MLFFEFPRSSHSWATRLGESKCLFLPFLYFSSFVTFISLSLRDCRKVLYPRPRELHPLPHFLPSPNAALPLERATKVYHFFLACFVERTLALMLILKRQLMWVISYLSFWALPQELTSPCTVRTQLAASQGLQQAAAHSFTCGLWGLRKPLHSLLL